MATPTFTWTPKRLVAAADPDLISKPSTMASALVTTAVAAGTLLESDATGYLKPYATVGAKVAGVLMHSVNTTTATVDNKGSSVDEYGNPYVALGVAAPQPITVWVAGDFFADQLVFPATATTNLLKSKIVEGSMIALTFIDLGEV